MITLTEKTVGIWYIQLTRDSDVLGSLAEGESGRFEFVYRFRYYTDDKAHDSNDIKNWYRVTLKDVSKEDALEQVKVILDALAKVAGAKEVYEFLNESGVDELMERFMKAPFTHVQNLGRPN